MTDRFFDAIIIGAGASGLFCAGLLANAGLDVMVCESGAKAGRKLAASGGGRPNFSNRNLDSEYYLCQPLPDFCQTALAEFGVKEILAWMNRLGLPYEERQHGRLFLKVPGQRFVEKLEKNGCGAKLVLKHACRKAQKNGDFFEVDAGSETLRAITLVLACGSPAWPALAGPADSWKLASSFGHSIFPGTSALAPLEFGENYEKFRKLSGISAEVKVEVDQGLPQGDGRQWRDMLLFTGSGLSGPAILRASLYWQPGAILKADFLPGENFEALLDANEGKTPRSLLRGLLPYRLADALLPDDIVAEKVARLGRATRRQLANHVNNASFINLRLSGLKKAEVCSGGIAVSEMNPVTMESRLVTNLFIMGEMLAVTGELGGYNLHWAFASAHLAAKAIMAGLKKR